MQFQWHEGDAGGGNLHILRSPLLAAEESRMVLTFWHWLSRLLWKPATKVCVVVIRNFQRIGNWPLKCVLLLVEIFRELLRLFIC